MAEEAQEQERPLPVVRSLTPSEKHLAEDNGMKLRQLEDGTKMWAVQTELRQRYNVLAPISTVAQVDSNWSPLPKIVVIEPGGYNTFKVGWTRETGEQHAMQRVALDALAEASGIVIHRQWTERFPEGFKVNVVTRRRRADGLFDQRVRGCEVLWADLAEEVELGKLEKWQKYNQEAWEKKERGEPLDGQERKDAKPPPSAIEVRREVLRERKFAPRKAETTAFGRCVRAHLGLPSAMPEKEYRKPFLCFTWVLTADYSRPGTRELVRQLHTDASAGLYGEEQTMAIEDATVDGESLLPHELPDSTIVHEQDGIATVADSESGEVIDADDQPVTEADPEYDFDDRDFEDPDESEQQGVAVDEPDKGFTIAKRHPKYGGQHVRDVVKDGEEGWDLIAKMAKDSKVASQQVLMLAWLSWASQNELTLEDL
jgi:hypothetical protein